MFRSLDGGATWIPMSQGLWQDRPIVKLAWSPADPSILYATDSDGRLYRSVDWGPWAAGFSNRSSLHALAADPSRPGVLWAYCQNYYVRPAICRSHDGGRQWQEIYPFSRPATVTGFAFDPRRSLIYAAFQSWKDTRRRILLSGDGGGTWRNVGRGLPPSRRGDLGKTGVAVAGDTGTLYVSILKDGTQATFRSSNQGQTWSPLAAGGFPIAAGPSGSVVTGSGARSLDGGQTWTTPPGLEGDVLSVATDPFDVHRALTGTRDHGVYRMEAASLRWTLSNRGLAATILLSMVADPSAPGTLYASVQGGGAFKTTQGGTVWERVAAGDLGALTLDPTGEPTLYATVLDSGSAVALVRSRDGAHTWETLAEFESRRANTFLAVDPSAPGSLFATDLLPGCAAAKSTDEGESWTCLKAGAASQIAVDPADPDNLYLRSHPILRSEDGGASWKTSSNGLEGDRITSLQVATSGTVYAGTRSRGVRRSTDRGATWQSANGALRVNPAFVTALAVDPWDARPIYAAIAGSVYRSRDGGNHWKIVGGPSRMPLVGPLLVDPSDPQTLYAGSASGGIYRIRFFD